MSIIAKSTPKLFLFLLIALLLSVSAVSAEQRSDNGQIDAAIEAICAATQGDPMGETICETLRRMFDEGRIKVKDLRDNHGGFTVRSDGSGEITVDSDIINDLIRLISTLIHEAQHAIDGYTEATYEYPGHIQALLDHIQIYLEQIRLLKSVASYFGDKDISDYIQCIIDEILKYGIPRLKKRLLEWKYQETRLQ